jgi:integral membrane protein
MSTYLSSPVGRLRLLALLEGSSLLFLVFIAVPLKYIWEIPQGSQFIGPIHGALFLLFVLSTINVAIQQRWKFTKVTWKVLIACVIPFGTFYIDHTILKNIHLEESKG